MVLHSGTKCGPTQSVLLGASPLETEAFLLLSGAGLEAQRMAAEVAHRKQTRKPVCRGPGGPFAPLMVHLGHLFLFWGGI